MNAHRNENSLFYSHPERKKIGISLGVYNLHNFTQLVNLIHYYCFAYKKLPPLFCSGLEVTNHMLRQQFTQKKFEKINVFLYIKNIHANSYHEKLFKIKVNCWYTYFGVIFLVHSLSSLRFSRSLALDLQPSCI